MLKLRYLLLALLLPACDDLRIVAPPSTSPNFEPIGESRECLSCGQRALELCQEHDPESYPKWFGFNAEGNCSAICSIGPTQFIGGIVGSPRAACPYQVNTTLRFNGEVCPSGTPERGDRDFWGHGPRFTATLTTAPDPTGNFAVGQIEATWAETQSDFSTITLPLTTLASSFRLTQTPTFSAQSTRVTRVSPSTSGRIDLVMSSRQQEVVSSGSGNGLLEQLVIVGDTHAGDISADGNCYDNARVNSVTFKPVRVTIEPRP